MPCGIRWKVFGLLALMAVLPLPLFLIAHAAIGKYAADRELVDALNDAQLAAKAIEKQLDRVDRRLTQIAIEHYAHRDSSTRDARLLSELKTERARDYKETARHQAGKVYNKLLACSSSEITGHIEIPKSEDSERILETIQARVKDFHVGNSHWLGPFQDANSQQVTCWAIYSLSTAPGSSETDRQQGFILAEINLTPAFENSRYPRNFVSILDRDGKRIFAPTPAGKVDDSRSEPFPGWAWWTANDDGKESRLAGHRYRSYSDLSDNDDNPQQKQSDGFELARIAGTESAYYRQLKIEFSQPGQIDDFRDFVDTKMQDFRSVSKPDADRRGMTRVACLAANEWNGELRIRGETLEEIAKTQADLLSAWTVEHDAAVPSLDVAYQSPMSDVALCMVGIDFPRTGATEDGAAKGIANPDFALINAISIAEIKKAAVSQLEGPALWLILGTLVICVLGVGYAWYVTQPLTAMTLAAEELTSRVRNQADGDVEEVNVNDVSLPVTRRDEVGALARAFAEMSEQVIASNSELNDRVGRRTSELETSKQKLEEYVATLQRTSHELQEQRDRAKLADKAKTGFLATVSHEMKTPLHWLNGYAGRLRKTELDGRQERCVDKIYEGIDQLTHLIGDVLDYQKILLGGMSVELETIVPAKFGATIVESMGSRAEERGNRLSFQTQCDVDEFVTDPHRLNQILGNLISNACKFTENGQIVLDLSVRPSTEDASERLVFTLTDTGVGIPPDHLNNLFTPFEKRKAKQGNNDGTGLGLVICRELARLLGGDVAVESELGVGTTFTVSLPTGLNPDASAIKPVGTSRASDEFDTGALFQGRQPRKPLVLIIDDDQRSTDLLSEELESANCRVISARSGESGIEQALMVRPDLIALDIVMPGMDGWEVLERLKDDARTKDIPVILVTIVSDSRKGLTLGADGYLTKPFEADELKRVMREVLGSHTGSVLIVDDDANSRELARDALDESTLNISEATNGEEALELIIDNVPDAVLLDLNMPRMDGFQLIEQLRMRDLLAQTKIIVVSGRELSVDERSNLSDAVISFFDKAALDEQQLKTEIRRLLKKTLPTAAASKSGV